MGKISFRLAVFALEGRGGGAAPGRPLDLWIWVDIANESREGPMVAAKGSVSTSRGDARPFDVRECLRALGLGFWRELRTLWPGELSGVLDRWADGGGGGGGREGANFAAVFASSSKELYS